MPQSHPFSPLVSLFLSILTITVSGEIVLFGKSSLVGGEASLVVKECLPEDAGAYTCVAENTAGKTSSSAAVCVRGKYVSKSTLVYSVCCVVYSSTKPLNVYLKVWVS